MRVEEDSSSDDEVVIAEELARQGLSSQTPSSRLDEELEKPAEAATHNTPAVHVMRQQVCVAVGEGKRWRACAGLDALALARPLDQHLMWLPGPWTNTSCASRVA